MTNIDVRKIQPFYFFKNQYIKLNKNENLIVIKYEYWVWYDLYNCFNLKLVIK